MTIAVMVKDAFEDNTIVVVPLETSYVQPVIASIRAACFKELKALHPFKHINESFSIMTLEHVLAKISASNEMPSS